MEALNSRDSMVRAAVKMAERAKAAFASRPAGTSHQTCTKPKPNDPTIITYELPWELIANLNTQQLAQHILKLMQLDRGGNR